MKDFIYGEGGALLIMIIDESIAHTFNSPDIIAHGYKWAVPFIVVGLIYLKRWIVIRVARKA